MLWRPITSYYKRIVAGNHEVRWRDDHGKDCQKTFRTKPEAIGWQEYLRTGEAPEYLPNKPANSISLREFVEIFRTRHCTLKAHATGKLYMRDLELWVLPYLGDKLMAKIDDDDIHAWMERLAEEKNPSPKSMANYRKTLHKVFKCAMLWKFEDRYGNRVPYVTKNPVATTKCLLPPEEKEMVTWSEPEQRKFLSHVLERNAFVYEVAHLVLGTGLRRGEVAALRPEHLDFDNRHIVVKESFCFHSRQLKHTKSKRIRLVPMNQEIFDLMRKYQEAPPEILIYDGFNTEKFSLKLSRWCQRAKVRKLGLHGPLEALTLKRHKEK